MPCLLLLPLPLPPPLLFDLFFADERRPIGDDNRNDAPKLNFDSDDDDDDAEDAVAPVPPLDAEEALIDNVVAGDRSKESDERFLRCEGAPESLERRRPSARIHCCREAM